MIKLSGLILLLSTTSLCIAGDETPRIYECTDLAQNLGLDNSFDQRCLPLFIKKAQVKKKFDNDKVSVYSYRNIIVTLSKNKTKIIAGNKTKLKEIRDFFYNKAQDELWVFDCDKSCSIKVFPFARSGNVVPIRLVESPDFTIDFKFKKVHEAESYELEQGELSYKIPRSFESRLKGAFKIK